MHCQYIIHRLLNVICTRVEWCLLTQSYMSHDAPLEPHSVKHQKMAGKIIQDLSAWQIRY